MKHIKSKVANICFCLLFTNAMGINLGDTCPALNNQSVSLTKNNKKYASGSFNYELSNDVSCYCIDISEMSYYKKRSVDNYLDQGGVILVNNKNVTRNDFQTMTASHIGTVGFLNNDKKGSFLFRNDDELQLWSYNLDFFNDTEIEDADTITKMTKEAESQITTDDIVNWILEFIENWMNYWKKHKSDKSKTSQLVELGTAHTAVIVPLLKNPKEIICSYQISATVRQGQKYLDKNNIRSGIYDITTQFGVDAEPDYAITEYTPYISSSEEILDATYLQSNVQTQYTLGGELGFSGKEVGAKVDFNYSYTGSSTDQKVVNDFPYGRNYRTWKMTPYESDNFNAAYVAEPGIRILSANDRKTMSTTLKFATLKAHGKGFWGFLRGDLELDDSYRYSLKLNWTADEEISYTSNIGA